MEIVDLGVMGIGQNEVVKRQVRLGKKMGVHLLNGETQDTTCSSCSQLPPKGEILIR
jgi:hypothetical protein